MLSSAKSEALLVEEVGLGEELEYRRVGLDSGYVVAVETSVEQQGARGES